MRLRAALLLVCGLMAALSAGYGRWSEASGMNRLVESPYNSIRVFDGVDWAQSGRAVRLMATDPGYSQSGMTSSRRKTCIPRRGIALALEAVVRTNGYQVRSVRPYNVGGAGQAGVETVQGAQNFKRLVGHRHVRSHKRGLIGAQLSIGAAGRAVPCPPSFGPIVSAPARWR